MPQQQLLIAQYNGVNNTRQALFSYLATLQKEDLFKGLPAFKNDSICRKLVHIANFYRYWLVYFDREITGTFYEDQVIKSLDDVRFLYEETDVIVEEFINRHSRRYEKVFTKKIPGLDTMTTTTPIMLFTHVITHEFHHKGQMMSMCRLMGYNPVDVGLIRTP